MTIDTGRQHVGFLFPEFPTDDFPMHNLYLGVTLRARRGNISARDGGSRIGVRKNGMRCVARHTVRRNDESLQEKSLTVNALRKILQDMILVNRSLLGDGSSFRVTLAAKERHFQHRCRRKAVFGRKNIMCTVTVSASRCKCVASGDGLSVERLRVLLLFRSVANPAPYLRQSLSVRQFLSFKVCMARDACKGRMNRPAERLLVHKDRERFPPPCSSQRLVAVTGEAVCVLLTHDGDKPETNEERQPERRRAHPGASSGAMFRYVKEFPHCPTSSPPSLSAVVVRSLLSRLFPFPCAGLLRVRADALLPSLLP